MENTTPREVYKGFPQEKEVLKYDKEHAKAFGLKEQLAKLAKSADIRYFENRINEIETKLAAMQQDEVRLKLELRAFHAALDNERMRDAVQAQLLQGLANYTIINTQPE